MRGPPIEISGLPFRRPWERSWFRRRLTAALRASIRRPVTVSVVLVDDRTIRRLNRKFLGHDYATDVIAFPLREISDFGFKILDCSEGKRRGKRLHSEIPLGEVYVSVTTARREAKARGIPFEEELLRYAVHGMLHLFGHDDKAPRARRRMWARQEALVRRVYGERVSPPCLRPIARRLHRVRRPV